MKLDTTKGLVWVPCIIDTGNVAKMFQGWAQCKHVYRSSYVDPGFINALLGDGWDVHSVFYKDRKTPVKHLRAVYHIVH